MVLAAAWTLALGLLAILTSGPWWAFVWQRTAQIGLVILALVSAEFASAFVQRPPRRWAWRPAIALLFILAALALDMLALLPEPFALIHAASDKRRWQA